ncbi:AvrD family protein [Streptomyces varsoviensis]|uniref:AvrD family protein n=1 Tax=Streptomyces varsoviensis TaxID=67373 RepID=UPI0033C7A3C5
MSEERLVFDSLDACLGPRGSRFFGTGYKRVGQQLHHIATDGLTGPGAGADARATLTYPADWSRKAAGRELRPHLSSIDALVLAASLAEIHLNGAHGLDEEQRRRTWLRSADIRAGSRPHEDLADFAVSARLAHSAPVGPVHGGGGAGEAEGAAAGPYAPVSSVYDCRIGELKVRCDFVHEAAGDRPRGPARYATDEEALGAARTRHYGAGYKAHSHHADGVSVDLAEQRVRARQFVVPSVERLHEAHGAEAAYAPSVSLVDTLVCVAQLAQALLYAQDGVDRGRSNTLWMRRTVVGAHSPLRPMAGPIEAKAYVTRTRLLGLGDGTWRVADLAVDDFSGIYGRCSIAHQLPMLAAA